jgi:pyruvate/oxaloacetate carboxyltransferase
VEAAAVEAAVAAALSAGMRTADVAAPGITGVGSRAATDAIIAALGKSQ